MDTKKKPLTGMLFLQILTGICFTTLFLSIAVAVVLNFRPLYYHDVRILNLAGTYGLSEEQICANYDTLIDYNSPFSTRLLIFPDLPSSREALIHFAEVKKIFLGFYQAGLISFLALCILLPALHAHITRTLRISALTIVLLPSVVGLAIACNFDRAFVLFHQIFFRNDFWLFNPATDPIILLLPDTFFLHCAAAIVILVLLSALLLVIFSSIITKHRR